MLLTILIFLICSSVIFFSKIGKEKCVGYHKWGREVTKIVASRSIRSLMEDFNGVEQSPETDTVLGTQQGTPGEGTSLVESHALHFLHRLLKETPDWEKEMTKIQQRVREEHGAPNIKIRKEQEDREVQTKLRGIVISQNIL